MTRRTLFMRLLGLLGAGVFARQALALGGWKWIKGPDHSCCNSLYRDGRWERIVKTERVHFEYVVERVEIIWWDTYPRRAGNGWLFYWFDRAMSTHGEALGKQSVYIGEPELAEFLAVKKGLVQLQPRIGGRGKVCQIGFCPGDGQWYGWWRWNIKGFGAGDYIFDPRGEFTWVTGAWHQAKLAASQFAEGVS